MSSNSNRVSQYCDGGGKFNCESLDAKLFTDCWLLIPNSSSLCLSLSHSPNYFSFSIEWELIVCNDLLLMYFFRFRTTAKKHLCLLNQKKRPKSINLKTHKQNQKKENKKKQMKSTQFQAIIKLEFNSKHSECTCTQTQTKAPRNFQNAFF